MWVFKVAKNKYLCEVCRKDFSLKALPSYCPYCGSQAISSFQKRSAIHAREILEQMEEIIPQVEAAWQAYTIEYVAFESLRQKAVVYANRGIISKDDIPTIEKIKLTDSLREHRGSQNPNPAYRPPMGQSHKGNSSG